MKIKRLKKNAFIVYFSAITACSQKVKENANIREATIGGIIESVSLFVMKYTIITVKEAKRADCAFILKAMFPIGIRVRKSFPNRVYRG
jgi:hypothetical protein